MTHIFVLCDHKTFIFLTVFFSIFLYVITRCTWVVVRTCNRINTPFAKGSLFQSGKVLDNLFFNYFLDVCRSAINFLPCARYGYQYFYLCVILISVVNITKLIYRQIEYSLNIQCIFNINSTKMSSVLYCSHIELITFLFF